MIDKLVIIGVGLIGGSLAKALKNKHYCRQIIGYSHNKTNLEKALNLGVIDGYTNNLDNCIVDADVIILATPIGSFAPLLNQIKPLLSPKTIISDVGSVKVAITQLANKILAKKSFQFVPAHPIAGKEKSGVDAADKSLFIDKQVIISPNNNPTQFIDIISKMWQATGAAIVQMPAAKHDKILSATSHLPHILAFALMDYLIKLNGNVFDYTAGGFKDFSRISSSNANMWSDICLTNKDNIINSINHYQQNLNHLKTLIENQDKKSLNNLFITAKNSRDNWLKDK